MAFGQSEGQRVWASVPDKVVTYDDLKFPRTALEADGIYHVGRAKLTEKLENLDHDIRGAARNVGPWAGSGTKDYIASQTASAIEKAVQTFETNTGLQCTPQTQTVRHVSPGLTRLGAAIDRAEIMASPEFVEANFRTPLWRNGKKFGDFAREFDLAAGNIFTVLNKVSTIQQNAGWQHAALDGRQPEQGGAVLSDLAKPAARHAVIDPA